MRLDQGGHLTHGSPASMTSKAWNFVSYGVTPRNDDPATPGEMIDFDNVRDMALAPPSQVDRGGGHRLRATHRPGAVPRDRRRGGRDVDVRLGSRRRSHRRRLAPQSRALRRRGHLHDPQDSARPSRRRDPVSRAITPRRSTWRSSPGSRVAPSSTPSPPRPWRSRRPRSPSFSVYTDQIVQNAARLRAPRWPSEGFRMVSGGTENHMVLLDLREFDADLTGKVAQEVLDRAGITTNRNTIPDDPRSPFITSGLRVGTAAETTAGLHEGEFATVASLMARALRAREDEAVIAEVRDEVAGLCADIQPLRQLHEVAHERPGHLRHHRPRRSPRHAGGQSVGATDLPRGQLQRPARRTQGPPGASPPTAAGARCSWGSASR